MKNKLYAAIATTCLCSHATADITIDFQESAPRDRFVIVSESCAAGPVEITIDLSPSAGALIFDVTAEGAGVEVFQPVEVQSGGAQASPVVDGDQLLTLTIPSLAAAAPVIISADLDDVLVDSQLGQIRVTGSELDGAVVVLGMGGQTATATFADGSNSVSFPNACMS